MERCAFASPREECTRGVPPREYVNSREVALTLCPRHARCAECRRMLPCHRGHWEVMLTADRTGRELLGWDGYHEGCVRARMAQ